MCLGIIFGGIVGVYVYVLMSVVSGDRVGVGDGGECSNGGGEWWERIKERGWWWRGWGRLSRAS